jgi:hypothetical protein
MEDELLKSLLENSEEDEDFPFGDEGLDDWDEEDDRIEDDQEDDDDIGLDDDSE